MRLGAIFTVFNGLELLKPAIRNIRPFVKYVAVVYSLRSNRGLSGPAYLKNLLSDLCRQGLVDVIEPYEAEPPATSPSEVVGHMRRKRELGRQICRSAGCTHIMVRDCDEFYPSAFLSSAIWLAGRYDITFTYSIDYTASPLCRSRRVRKHDRVPFVQRVEFPFGPFNFGFRVDPARSVVGTRSRFLFPSWMLVMHHMTRVRLNEEEMRRKYENHSWYDRTHEILRLMAETRQPDPKKHRGLKHDQFKIRDYWDTEFSAYTKIGSSQ